MPGLLIFCTITSEVVLEFKRSDRVGEMIHKELSLIFNRGLKDPRIGFVTLTAVDVTADLSIAKVYYTVMGDEQARKETAKGLEKATPYIRRMLSQQLKMRHTPSLDFKYDTSIEYGNHIDSLLKEIENERSDDQGDS